MEIPDSSPYTRTSGLPAIAKGLLHQSGRDDDSGGVAIFYCSSVPFPWNVILSGLCVKAKSESPPSPALAGFGGQAGIPMKSIQIPDKPPSFRSSGLPAIAKGLFRQSGRDDGSRFFVIPASFKGSGSG